MNEKSYWIGFNRVRGIGPVKVAALLDRFGTLAAAWHAPIHELQAAGLDRRSLENLLKVRQELDLAAAWRLIQFLYE